MVIESGILLRVGECIFLIKGEEERVAFLVSMAIDGGSDILRETKFSFVELLELECSVEDDRLFMTVSVVASALLCRA